MSPAPPLSQPDNSRSVYIAVFLLTVAVRLGFHALTGFIFDDAFITFRYADNIAAGAGFVFNPGEQVLGTTTPLFTLILAALAVLGVPPTVSGVGIGVVCASVTGVIVYAFARRWNFGRFALLPWILYLLFPRLLGTDTGGMETALFTMLAMGALYCRVVSRPSAAVGLAALAALVRPEGLLLLLMLLIAEGVADPRRIPRYLALSVGILLPWVVFATAYFGSPVPNSIAGKLALYSIYASRPMYGKLIFLLALHNPFGIVLLVLALLGAWQLAVRQRAGRFELLWMLLLLAGFTLSRTFIFLWYPAPIYPLYLLGAAAVILWLRDHRSRADYLAGHRYWWLLAVAAVALLLANVRTVRGYRLERQVFEQKYMAIGRYLKAQANPHDVVAGEDIGYMSYYSGLRFIDRDGLITPQAAAYNRRGDYFGLIRDSDPDWVVAIPQSGMSDFVEETAFKARYELVRAFGEPPAREYCVYRRRIPPPDTTQQVP
ncbi:MAG TPA: hypothetical protein VM118_05190 [Acidobacteriota bacterium]|nr:hypothetical protein [Acidobacteriota bacterium]